MRVNSDLEAAMEIKVQIHTLTLFRLNLMDMALPNQHHESLQRLFLIISLYFLSNSNRDHFTPCCTGKYFLFTP